MSKATQVMMHNSNHISLKSGYKLFAAISATVVLFVLAKQLYERHIFLKTNQTSFYAKEAIKLQSAINDSISYAENCSTLIADKISDFKPLSTKAISLFFNSTPKEHHNNLVDNIAELARPNNHKIKEYLEGKHTEYIVLNRNFEPIASSNAQIIFSDLSLLQSMTKDLNLVEGKLSSDFTINDIRFRYYKKDPNYGYTILVGISDKSRSRLFIDNLREHTITPLLLIVAFAMTLFFFSKMMLHPVTLLARNALDIAKGKKAKYKFSINSQEAADLSVALNMFESSISDSRKIQHDLQHQSQKLEAMLLSNNEFINNLSHEVRTPIHGINALSMGLVENWYNLDNKNAHTLAIKIAANSQRLLSLVNNILDISKTQHEDMHLNLQNISLNQLIQDMIKESKNLYLLDKNISIKFYTSDDITLLIDPDKITQILRNLLSNAIKVTAHGVITISWKRIKDKVCVTISDEGIGIPEKELKTIFESFKQSSRTKNKISGIGLGLSISNKIIKAHGGKIWAENNKTKGASFMFTLPIPKTTKQSVVTKNDVISTSSTKANIMIIDDEETCLLSAEMIIQSTKYNIVTYLNPLKALEWLKQNPHEIALIMVDMMIPEMSGIEFLDSIKSDTSLKDIPVVLQSGTADNLKIQTAFAKGALDFIAKPYNREDFVRVVEKYLHRSAHTISSIKLRQNDLKVKPA
jgi:signal transduction histidine kinase/CheY-like chemotaxis protein